MTKPSACDRYEPATARPTDFKNSTSAPWTESPCELEFPSTVGFLDESHKKVSKTPDSTQPKPYCGREKRPVEKPDTFLAQLLLYKFQLAPTIAPEHCLFMSVELY